MSLSLSKTMVKVHSMMVFLFTNIQFFFFLRLTQLVFSFSNHCFIGYRFFRFFPHFHVPTCAPTKYTTFNLSYTFKPPEELFMQYQAGPTSD